jgi:hypothetical protein
MVRRDTLDRAQSGVFGWTARGAVSLVAAAADPLNLASAFIPVIAPEVYMARIAAQTTRLRRVGVAARVGAVEGAVGQALIEPAMQFFAYDEQRNDDYGFAAALRNVAFGAVFGSVVHGAGRAVVDGWRGLPRMEPGVEREVHDGAMRVALSQLETGRQVDVEPVFTAARMGAREELMGSASAMAMRMDAPEVRAVAPEGVAASVPEAASVPAIAADRAAPLPERIEALAAAREADPEVRALAERFTASQLSEDARVTVRETAAIRQELDALVERLAAEAPPARPVEPGAAEPAPRTDPTQPDLFARGADEPATPEATRQMIERASRDTVRGADPQAWARVEAARAREVGGMGGPRVNTPAARVEAQVAQLDAMIAEQAPVLDQAVARGILTEAEARPVDVQAAEALARERAAGLEAGAACLILNGARP